MHNSSYQENVKQHLSRYKKEILKINTPGTWHNRGEYDHILPESRWMKNLLPYSEKQILSHMKEKGIKWHPGRAHLNSSQVLCVNLFYPFMNDLSYLNSYFKDKITGFQKLHSMDFEWSEKTLLNEKTPTSVDLAMTWIDDQSRCNMFLFEFKYTEASFGGCRYFCKEKCVDYNAIHHAEKCHPTNEGVNYSKYLQKKGPIKTKMFENEERCPYSTLYQLMRNQVLAQALENSGRYHKVVFGVIYPEQNLSLEKHYREIRIREKSAVSWNELVTQKDRFIAIKIEELLHTVMKESPDVRWKTFILEKYGPTLNLRIG